MRLVDEPKPNRILVVRWLFGDVALARCTGFGRGSKLEVVGVVARGAE